MLRLNFLGFLLAVSVTAVGSAQPSPPPAVESAAGVAITPRDNYEQWKEALTSTEATSPDTFTILPGFSVEMLRSARPEEGSWIALTLDPKGRIIIAREKQGLLRLTPSRGEMQVEVIDDTLVEVRGLLHSSDSIYANSNGSRGLFRLRPNARDAQYDVVATLTKTIGGRGHGRNGLAWAPDGGIALIHGDSVEVPPGVHRLTPPLVSGLLPADDRPHGHLLHTDPEGKQFTLVASGLRNPVGVDYNADGEAFTYDADAETDMGTPWYRGTHVRHLVSGADFGWRLATGRWPPYYVDQVDNPPSTLLVGKGSPTAVRFGTRSRFPPAYQRALYILDWTYGRIIAVHLTPQGASYSSWAETFLRGRPLNVTGLEFGPDGAMYFVTGGRSTQSALYRVRYTGPAVSTPSSREEVAQIKAAAEARALRRRIEIFHGRKDPAAVGTAWQYLDHADPWIAHAARVAIEHQDATEWGRRALEESAMARAMPAMMSLTRVGPDEFLPAVVDRLARIQPSLLPAIHQQMYVRTAAYATQRLGALGGGRLGDVNKERLVAHLDSLVPQSSPEVKREAVRLLLELAAPAAVSKGVALLTAASTQEDKLHYLQLLGRAQEGWTGADRIRYFRVLAQAPAFRGGAGLPKTLQKIEQEAMQTVPEADRPQYAAILDAKRKKPSAVASVAETRAIVKEWAMTDLEGSLGGAGKGRDFERGKSMFATATCIVCHQMGDEGNAVGPDLTDVASRFNRRDLLDSILEPSREVSETYRTIVVTTKQGTTVAGRLALADYRLPVLRLAVNLMAPDEVVEIPKSDIATYSESEVSLMPKGLLDRLTQEEILDLLAYIEAGGDRNHRNFAR